MALALNTSHALYGNLKAFICVDDDNSIKDLKNPTTTFTVDAAVVIGTGTYGRHFRTLVNGYDPTLVTAATNVPSITGTGSLSVVLVFNQIAGQAGGNPAPLAGGTHGTAFQKGGGGIQFGRWNGSGVDYTTESAGTISNGAHTVCMSRVGSTSHSFFKDGASVSTGGQLGNETGSGYIGPFGGAAGNGSTGADFVYAMVFDKALSLAEYQEIHNGLAGGNVSTMLGSSDTTAPTLSSPTGTTTGSTTANGSVDTNEANGTLYRLASTNATETAATVKAAALTTAVTATGTQAVSFTGLTPSTTYYAHYVHRDAAGNDSARVSSTSFTTTAGGDTTPPTLTSPTGTGGVLSASGSVSTNEANGTLYFYCSANATETAATVKASGSSQAVTTTGLQSVNFGAVTAGTRYAHYVHRDVAGNDSTRVSSSSFTVTAAGTCVISGVKNDAGTLQASVTIDSLVFIRRSDRTLVLALTNQGTNGGGVLSVTNVALVPGTDYAALGWNNAGTASLRQLVTAT